MKLDEVQWKLHNADTRITWSEDDVYKEYIRLDGDQGSVGAWCQIMMAGILGKEVAMNKYPEMYL